MTESAFSLAVNLDHVGWWVGDLANTRLEFERLGFSVTRPASLLTGAAEDKPHDEGQSSSHVMFQHTYLELTTVSGGDMPAHLAGYQSGSGLRIVALGCPDARMLHDDLAREGWDLVEPARSERLLDYGPATDAPVRFQWFMATPQQFPEVLVCMVEHLDRQRLFDPSVTKQPNHVTELTEVLMLCDDPRASFLRYEPLGAADDSATGWLTFLSPDQASLAYPGVDLPALAGGGCTPMGVVLSANTLDGLRDKIDGQSGGEIWFPAPGRTIVVVRERSG